MDYLLYFDVKFINREKAFQLSPENKYVNECVQCHENWHQKPGIPYQLWPKSVYFIFLSGLWLFNLKG
jgi:hypothetical protein